MSRFSIEEQLVGVIVANDLAMVRELLNKVENINYQSLQSGGYSFLHFAAQSQSSEISKLLLAKNINVELEDRYGNTPLCTAVFNYSGDGSVIEQLIAHGADPNHLNRTKMSPRNLAYTIANTDVRKYFPESM